MNIHDMIAYEHVRVHGSYTWILYIPNTFLDKKARIAMNCNSIMANKHLTKNSNKNKSKLGTLNLHIFVDRYDSLSQINIYYHSLTIIYHIYPQIYLDLYITNTKQNKTKNNGNIFFAYKKPTQILY